jgi:hypothetical protein
MSSEGSDLATKALGDAPAPSVCVVPGDSNLASLLLAHRPREISGAQAANRFAYQRTWALCHLLALHEGGGNYVLILEFHDDILVLDDASDPKAADFFQVKTRNGRPWTKSDLIRAPKASRTASARSILGKLLEHCRTFDTCVRSLNLISNARFDVELSAAPKSQLREAFALDAAKPSVLDELETALNQELQLPMALPWSKLHFRCTPISLEDHETHGAGRLAAFLERRLPGGRFAVHPLYRAISGEFERRATCEWQPSSFAELCNTKGLRRADVEEFLRHAAERPDPEEQLRSVVAALTAEGCAYREVTNIQEGWRRYDIWVTDMTDVFIQGFRQRIQAIAEEVAQLPNWQRLDAFIAEGQALYLSRHGALVAPLTSTVLQGALLRELKNYEARKSAAIDPQPQEKAP